MSAPFADAPDRWGLVFHGDGQSRPAHTRPEWARIARAIRGADGHLASSANPTRRRGDAVWCQVALDIHAELRDAGAYDDLALTEAVGCYADRSAIRAWLGAPVVPIGDTPRTMLEAEGLDRAFPTDRPTDPTALPLLVGRAQDVGVFGIPANHMRLWRCVGSRATQPYTYVLTVSPPHDADLAGWPMYLGHTLNLDRPQADTVVSALTQVAEIANNLLANAGASDTAPRPAIHQGRPPGPEKQSDGEHADARGSGIRAFPAPSTKDAARPVLPPVLPTPDTDRAHRRR